MEAKSRPVEMKPTPEPSIASDEEETPGDVVPDSWDCNDGGFKRLQIKDYREMVIRLAKRLKKAGTYVYKCILFM